MSGSIFLLAFAALGLAFLVFWQHSTRFKNALLLAGLVWAMLAISAAAVLSVLALIGAHKLTRRPAQSKLPVRVLVPMPRAEMICYRELAKPTLPTHRS